MSVVPPTNITKVAVFGAGQFGFALATLLGANNPKMQIVLYDPVKEYVESIQKNRAHPVFHKGVTLTTNCSATHDRYAALEGAQVLLLAVPGQFLRALIKSIVGHIKQKVILLNVAKALEQGTNKNLSEVVTEEMELCKYPYWFAALSGGMIAEEVTQYWPIAADVACTNIEVATLLQKLFSTPHFKVNTTSDILGVELAGALKNVVAIGAGFFDGLGYDMSSKAAYVSEAAREIRDLAVHLGAKRETFELGTHAWLGDLLTTSFGKSRNRLFGDYLGRGMTVQEALGELQKARKISEGYLTCKSFYEVAVQKGISTPILKVVYSVLWQNASVKEVLLHMFTHEEMPPGSVPHAPMGKAKL